MHGELCGKVSIGLTVLTEYFDSAKQTWNLV